MNLNENKINLLIKTLENSSNALKYDYPMNYVLELEFKRTLKNILNFIVLIFPKDFSQRFINDLNNKSLNYYEESILLLENEKRLSFLTTLPPTENLNNSEIILLRQQLNFLIHFNFLPNEESSIYGNLIKSNQFNYYYHSIPFNKNGNLVIVIKYNNKNYRNKLSIEKSGYYSNLISIN